MINYDTKRILHLFGVSGSVLPRVIRFSLPSFLVTLVVKANNYRMYGSFHEVWDAPHNVITMAWSMFTVCLGFLIVFRANLAYSRYWEGSTLIEQARGSWINAVSNLIAFCNPEEARRGDTRRFQHLLVRLMSLLFAKSLTDVADDPRIKFSVLDQTGMDKEGLIYLEAQTRKREIVLQWIQRLVVDGERSGVLKIAPPILSRVFQELSNGIVHMNDARKITIVPFPFPFAQVTFVMVGLLSYVAIPMVCGFYLTLWTSAFYSITISAVYWVCYHIALEIEMPFGLEPNQLPVDQFQNELNTTLLALIDARSQRPPQLHIPDDTLDDDIQICHNDRTKRRFSTHVFGKRRGVTQRGPQKEHIAHTLSTDSSHAWVSERGSPPISQHGTDLTWTSAASIPAISHHGTDRAATPSQSITPNISHHGSERTWTSAPSMTRIDESGEEASRGLTESSDLRKRNEHDAPLQPNPSSQSFLDHSEAPLSQTSDLSLGCTFSRSSASSTQVIKTCI